jgi:isoleucyl-tRNA synthetase
VHLALFPDMAEIVPGAVAGVEADWKRLGEIRELVLLELEALRFSKSIGKSLDASVVAIVEEGSTDGILLTKYESELAEFFNVSQATVQSVGATQSNGSLLLQVKVAEGAKCARCWRTVSDVGADARWSEVCTRCADALDAIAFPPMNQEPA